MTGLDLEPACLVGANEDLDSDGVDSWAVASFDDDRGSWDDFSSCAWFVTVDLSSA